MRSLRLLATTAFAFCLTATGSVQARALTVRDEGYLRFSSSSGSQLLDHGELHGTLPGQARVSFVYDGNPTISANFVIYGPGWSLKGHATCRLNSPNSPAPSFRGSLTLAGGTGRYAHSHGSGELFGVFYRHSYALRVQAIGKLQH